jgi:hypothetical protein
VKVSKQISALVLSWPPRKRSLRKYTRKKRFLSTGTSVFVLAMLLRFLRVAAAPVIGGMTVFFIFHSAITSAIHRYGGVTLLVRATRRLHVLNSDMPKCKEINIRRENFVGPICLHPDN